MTSTSSMSKASPSLANRYAIDRARPRIMLIWGVVLLAIVAVIGMIIRTNPASPPWQGLDQAWRNLVGGAPGDQNSVLSLFMQSLGQFPTALIVMLGPVVVLLILRHWWSALFYFTASVAHGMVAQVFKKLVDRPRPPDPLVPKSMLDHGSFPSGHCATIAFVCFGVAAVLIPMWRRYWWIIGGLLCAGMVWQRTMVGAHWLSDTFAGLAVGAGTVLILWWAFYPLIRRDFRPKVAKA